LHADFLRNALASRSFHQFSFLPRGKCAGTLFCGQNFGSPAGDPLAPAKRRALIMSAVPVSVVIPAYNVEDCLARAIGSVLAQTSPPAEILVVDDGSSDGTRRVAEKFGERIRLVSHPHAGAAAARNLGIAASSEKLVAFLDADDEWLDSKLARQVPLHSDPELVFSFSRSNEFSIAGEDLGDTFADFRASRGADAWRSLLAVNCIATPTVIARRADLVAVGGFDRRLKVAEDQDMWIRLALRGPIDFIDESLARIHMRPASLSSARFQDQLDFTWPMILGHLKALAPRLGNREIRTIRAERLGRMGRTAYAHGELRLALGLVCQAMLLGDRPFHNVYHLAAAAPPIRWMRQRIARS
jgi:glycosyltransferase involved in cell wall biosynthesis